MSTRRKFLFLSSMASAAFVASKPMGSFANTGALLTGSNGSKNALTLLHTGKLEGVDLATVNSAISHFKNNAASVAVLNACDANPVGTVSGYDACINNIKSSTLAANQYKILYKGNVKIGIIAAGSSDTEPLQTSCRMAEFLKKEKHCHLVVCLSGLGFKNKYGIDDRKFAQASTGIDVVIGGEVSNSTRHTHVLLNKNKEEVIINGMPDRRLAVGALQISFDRKGNKRGISPVYNMPV